MRVPSATALLLAAAVLAGSASSAHSQLPAVASRPQLAGVGPNDPLAQQVRLDRLGFSPGVIDGTVGSNTRGAIAAFQRARALSGTNGDADVGHALEQASPDAVLVDYTIDGSDVAGPFAAHIPRDLMAQAALEWLAYQSPLEWLAERFHTTPALLRRLNPRARFDAAGETIRVPDVAPVAWPQAPGEVGTGPKPSAVLVTVSSDTRALTVHGADGSLLLHAPVTVGSAHDPLPVGEWTVTTVFHLPIFNYNPALFWDADPSHAKARIPPGPNNPVGVTWIGLSRPHYGIHGTPEPSRIGYTESHGCVRLTNWDVLRVAGLVSRGTRVIFQ